ncbi:MAG: DUF1223 domain-containing protein [Pseudomonadota bacterium]
MKKRFLSLAVAGLLALTFGFANPAQGSQNAPIAVVDQPVAVIELFTSQGCSSCPKADKYLGALAKRDDVIALSWHVDYWNYLGWSDTFSKPEFSDRQRRYAVSLKSKNYYTPQMVVNGQAHGVGSQPKVIQAVLAAHAAQALNPSIAVKAYKRDMELRISVEGAGHTFDGSETLWLVRFDKQKTVEIKRGENAGTKITYHNVVRGITMLGMVKNGRLDVVLPIAELKRQGFDGCALLLQKMSPDGLPGPIVGATLINSL